MSLRHSGSAGPFLELLKLALDPGSVSGDRWHLLRNLCAATCGCLSASSRSSTRQSRPLRRRWNHRTPRRRSVPSSWKRPASLPLLHRRTECHEIVAPSNSASEGAPACRSIRAGPRAGSETPFGPPDRAGTGHVAADREGRYHRCKTCPDWNPGRLRRSRVDAHRVWIDARLDDGVMNVVQLHRELKERGFAGSYDSIWRYVSKRLGTGDGSADNCAAKPLVQLPSAKQLSFEWLRRAEARKPAEQARLDAIRSGSDELAAALDVADEFAALIRKQSRGTLSDWLVRGEGIFESRTASVCGRNKA